MGHFENCRILAQNIKDGLIKSNLEFKKFIEDFIYKNEKVKSSVENELQDYESYRKMFYRVKASSQANEKTLCKLQEIYDFLLKQDAYRKMHCYKPPMDDSFEREILGDDLYENIKRGAKEMFNNDQDN